VASERACWGEALLLAQDDETIGEGHLRGVELRRRDHDLVGRCPFHEDHTPSLAINPERNLWHCLGACQAGGSCIDWVMRERGVSFRHAVELLRADLPSVAGNGHIRGATVRMLPPPVDLDADDQELLQQVVAFYHRTLLDSPEALAYLHRRGLRNSELVERFHLGFANRTLGCACRWATARPAPTSEAACSGSASSATRGTSTSTARW
jgi:DNA primase